MIYIILGNDHKKKSSFLQSISLEEKPIIISKEGADKEMVVGYAKSKGLFGGNYIFLMEEFLKENTVSFKKEELLVLSESNNIFIFLEEKLSAKELKKYEDFSKIKRFDLIERKKTPKINIFDIANHYSRKNKIGTWMYFRKAIELGVSPEEMIGILLWKIRTMLLGHNNFFSKDELSQSFTDLTDLYHLGHLGKIDLTIGLEQFLLSSLSKK